MNNDRIVSALDALMIINDLNKLGPRSLSFGEGEADSSFAMLDVSGDEKVTALDALMVINEMNGEKPVTVAIEEPLDEETITDGDTTTDEEVSTEETDTTTETVPVDDTTTDTDNDDVTNETETGQEVDNTPAEDDETEEEPVDDTMVDDGPLEEEREGCHGGRRDPFAWFDANEDGLLTVDEVPATLWERLVVAGTDEDGAISPAELEAIAHEHHRGDPFARFDANADGALTVDEVPQRLWERLSQADADEDGAVTADELAEARASAGEGHLHHRRHHGHHDR